VLSQSSASAHKSDRCRLRFCRHSTKLSVFTWLCDWCLRVPAREDVRVCVTARIQIGQELVDVFTCVDPSGSESRAAT
jgi:hypothetical protein